MLDMSREAKRGYARDSGGSMASTSKATEAATVTPAHAPMKSGGRGRKKNYQLGKGALGRGVRQGLHLSFTVSELVITELRSSTNKAPHPHNRPTERESNSPKGRRGDGGDGAPRAKKSPQNC